MDESDQHDPSVGDWDPRELEANGQELLARIRRHLETIRQQPVTTDIGAAQLTALLDDPLPERPTPFGEVLDDTWERVVPHLTHWHHPSFHAYFSTSTSGPAILAEALTATFNVNAHVWKSAPAAAAVEGTVLRWMAQMTGYPEDADGVLLNGASLATLYALTAARDGLTDLAVRERGIVGRDLPVLRLYTSDQAHNSVDKAAITLGIGTDNVVRLPVDARDRMDPRALREALRDDVRRGLRPFAVVATVGTTATGAIDPLPEIAAVCREFGVWLHVDAAYGGFWRLVDGIRPEVDHLGLADSVVVNPHKVLFSSLEVTALYSPAQGRAGQHLPAGPGVSAHHPRGRGRRLHEPQSPTGPPVPGVEALVDHPLLRPVRPFRPAHPLRCDGRPAPGARRRAPGLAGGELLGAAAGVPAL